MYGNFKDRMGVMGKIIGFFFLHLVILFACFLALGSVASAIDVSPAFTFGFLGFLGAIFIFFFASLFFYDEDRPLMSIINKVFLGLGTIVGVVSSVVGLIFYAISFYTTEYGIFYPGNPWTYSLGIMFPFAFLFMYLIYRFVNKFVVLMLAGPISLAGAYLVGVLFAYLGNLGSFFRIWFPTVVFSLGILFLGFILIRSCIYIIIYNVRELRGY